MYQNKVVPRAIALPSSLQAGSVFSTRRSTTRMMPNRYNFFEAEPRLAGFWADAALYAFDPSAPGPIYTIDTPPPTVSGELHIGHCYSYTQTDIIARYHRMRGENVLYPMGFDDNGLPTERFVEKSIERKATEMDRQEFITRCLELIEQTEGRFESLWRRLGLSVDWNYRYSTISSQMQRVSQWSFIQLYRSGLAYRQVAPTLWCPECQTPQRGRDLPVGQSASIELDKGPLGNTLHLRGNGGVAVVPINAQSKSPPEGLETALGLIDQFQAAGDELLAIHFGCF